ncbi:glycoside hydrolase family 3 N-terminal domain-containing protein [Actinomycetaceae bacterium MB13-C1-2]|nr:glycoside hydrolase family 3 N-terminal domain-containing protein [Actinomycetaceae bacterium MB13-C1-2]
MMAINKMWLSRGAIAIVAAMTLSACSSGGVEQSSGNTKEAVNSDKEFVTRDVTDGTTTFTEIKNPNGGATLSYSPDSGVTVLSVEEDEYTYAFKDMNGSGELEPWEDWRLSPEERAKDLAPQLTTEQIAGLMLFSPSEYAVGDGLTDAQRKYLSEDNLRLVLSAGTNETKPNVLWSNEVQAYVESLATPETPYIPVNFSTDPRSDAMGGYAGNATADISMWPGNLGLAATFDPEVTRRFAEVAGEEYRALGITNILGPQVDIATDPRWTRANGTFGENTELSTEMTKAYVQGFQTSQGDDSVIPISTTIKHFAGDAAGEGGRPSYYDHGKYAVFPNGNYDEHLKPFVGSLDAMGAMTAYSIFVDGEGKPLFDVKEDGTGMGAAFSKELVDKLRVDNGYEGVIMTDWGVTAGGPDDPDASWFTNWGVDELTVADRHFLVLLSGVDMFGGNTEVAPVLAAYNLWDEAYESGDVDIDADTRFEQSAERILKVIFASGLYDNPYLDLEHSESVAGSEEKMAEGFEAQKQSVVVLKNENDTIACGSTPEQWSDAVVYIPSTHGQQRVGLLVSEGEVEYGPTIETEVAEQYFGKVITDEVVLDDDGQVVDYKVPDLTDVDMVLVGMESPNPEGQGYLEETGEYVPISLQYRPYTADSDSVRKTSIAGNRLEDGAQENRSYFGKTGYTTNEADLDAIERASKAVKDSGKDIPLVAVLKARNPIIPGEFEALSDAIVVGFDISEAALIEVALGMYDGSGRLPMTFPANMEVVEASYEDVAGDYEAYVDSMGNAYDFGFGLSCSGEPIK